MKGVQWLTSSLWAQVLQDARRSPRRRMNFNLHAGPQDNPHRFFNVLLRGTYIAPHRHVDPPKSETFLVLEGRAAFFLFDDQGEIIASEELGGERLGVDIAPGLWHSLAVLTDHAVCFEVKPGPWAPATDKEFAPWAPREGEPGTEEYLQHLLASRGIVSRED
jgi:cupin fold WbuC family metalloprotein